MMKKIFELAVVVATLIYVVVPALAICFALYWWCK